MSDRHLWNAPLLPARKPKPGDLLFGFVGGHDKRLIRCELRFHGESFGWEAQFLDHGGLFHAHGAFVTRALAVAWAEDVRRELETL